jgi:hypothetical protein
MFHSKRRDGDTNNRYSGKFVAIGKRKKNVVPAASVIVLTNSHNGVTAVARMIIESKTSTCEVR